jgi:hypothetical protein
MRIFLMILFFLLAGCATTNSLSQTNSTKPTQKKISEARAFVDTWAKNICVSFFTERQNGMRALQNARITLSEQCSCTQRESNYLVSDDLAIAVDKESDNWSNANITPPNIREWYKIVHQSMERCSEQLMRRR